ncbi:shikimate dehydrogenase [Salinihabitans flavidus]|uniref:Shikimate dehydrogenase (NADP(+)) n=1 Tax=Salinihabitans flavidus TaxID=569882 RepID=A0A1H8W3X8_9RHOB|nr:shikimate dehydrogenase [Salinihabitans flavidus]SEP22310.1 shikimate dehydrogenase [Salinihabitans flavidus]
MRLAQAENGSDTGEAAIRMGLIGGGIRLSRTPAMHEAEAAAQGLACHYELLDTDAGTAGDLQEILDRSEAAGFAGLNVTFPYKQAVIAHLDQLSDAARRIAAVNTIVFRDGRRFGHNTDFWGFSESLRRGLPDAALGTVLLIGAGGAGAALAHALVDMKAANLLIADTRKGAADELARAAGPCASAVTDVAAAAAAADGIVNATPVGMAKLPGTPIDPALLAPRHWVADIVYFPLETELLRVARSRGCRTLSGEGMAVFQAVRAFELFTGRTADPARMRETFRSLGDE